MILEHLDWLIILLLPVPTSSITDTPDTSLASISTLGSGDLVFGPETLIQDFALLSVPTPASLPPAFTVCSSLLTHPLPTIALFFSLLQQDGSPWLALTLSPLPDMTSTRHTLSLAVQGRDGKTRVLHFPGEVAVVPQTWLRACLALDTATGLVTVTADGLKVAEEMMAELEGSEDMRPVSLDRRLVLGKLDRGVYWYQVTASLECPSYLLPRPVARSAGWICTARPTPCRGVGLLGTSSPGRTWPGACKVPPPRARCRPGRCACGSPPCW